MSKFGLGKGLADLKRDMGNIPDISVLTGTERVAVKQVPIIQIGANPDQPRKSFSESELADLAASIKEQGVLQPILLRAVKSKPYSYEIIAGERRYRASKMAGLSEIPALVKSVSDENAMEIALIENVQRENLNPMEEAAAYKNLMTSCGYELDDVSRLIGKSASYIRNIMRLDGLPDSVKRMVESGELSASHARTIAVAEDPLRLANEIVKNKWSVADTATRVKETTRASKSRSIGANSGDNSLQTKEFAKKLEKTLKTPVKVNTKRSGAGEIVISFSSRMHLEELIPLLGGVASPK
jgi:ParB family chromosome partitioning protein